MYLWRSLRSLYLHVCQVRVTVLRSSLCYQENVSLAEFMYLVLTRMPGESYRTEVFFVLVTRMYLWWSLCTLYLHACQVRVTVLRSSLCYLRECISGGVYVPCTYTHARWELPYWGDSGLCCCVCVTSFDFERYCLLPCVLTTLCSAKVKRLGEIQITFDSFNPNSKILAKLGFRLYQCPRRSRQ